MKADFEHHHVRLSQVSMHYVTAGPATGAPVLLLHGWPSTWYEWRHVMGILASEGYRAIAPDLRGLGDTTRPLDGYDSESVASDIVELVGGHFDFEHFHLVGHDWGGPTAFAAAVAIPDAVQTFTIVDVTVPGLGPDVSQGGKRWHHAFHMTPDLPETLIAGRERAYLSWFYREFSWMPDAIGEADIDEYVRCYSKPGALRSGFAYYRNIPANKARNQHLKDEGFRMRCPVLAVGGGRAESRGRGTEPAESLREVASDVTEVVIEDSGHFVPEEQPEEFCGHLINFFDHNPIG